MFCLKGNNFLIKQVKWDNIISTSKYQKSLVLLYKAHFDEETVFGNIFVPLHLFDQKNISIKSKFVSEVCLFQTWEKISFVILSNIVS